MKTASSEQKEAFKCEGYILLREFFENAEIFQALSSIQAVLNSQNPSLLITGQSVYAARNLTQLWPEFRQWAFHPSLCRTLQDHFEMDFGLVRAIYFDKNPNKPWGLPWHQDMAIAVKTHTTPSLLITNPTIKRGVPHVEASDELLSRMVTVRIHLDDAHEANGALEVVPGSHRKGKRGYDGVENFSSGKLIACAAGDVLLMRPLLYHRSAKPTAGNRMHRRILHFEYAVTEPLPDGFEWHEFHRV